MIQTILLFVSICFAVIGISAQTSTNYGGTWELDTTASKLDERTRVESIKLIVTQTDKELSVTSETKRQAPSAGERPANGAQRGESRGGGRMGGGMGRGGMGGGLGAADGKLIYSLDGKETSDTQVSAMGSVPVKLKAQVESNKLKLSVTRTLTTQMGEMTIKTKEEWSLSPDGKVLTIKRETENPRGSNSTTLVFKRS